MKLKLALFAVTLLLSACFENQGVTFHFDAETVCPESGRGYFTDDRDGKEYQYTTIGAQVWMAENLNYKNDTYYCADKFIENYCATYGGLYNFPVWDSIQTICPQGWHVPAKAEWEEMIDVMGGEKYINKGVLRTKEGWFIYLSGTDTFVPDTLGTNICGFTALPGGGGNITSAWKYDRGETSWWTSTLTESGLAETYYMRLYINGYGNGFESLGTNSLGEHLIRCVKDEP